MKYFYQTAAGTVSIIYNGSSFRVIFEGEDLGAYKTAAMAAESVALGQADLPISKVNLASLGIPADLTKWERQ